MPDPNKKLNIKANIHIEVTTADGKPFHTMNLNAEYPDAPLDVLHMLQDGLFNDFIGQLPVKGQTIIDTTRDGKPVPVPPKHPRRND